jgi:plastocyanin
MSRTSILGLITGVALALACGNPSGEGNGCGGTGAQHVINAQDDQHFVPTPLTVTHGESVCWQNNGSITHTVTANGATGILDSSWVPDSVNAQLSPGSLFLRTFSKQGVHYFYKCSIHAGMTGEIDVL